MNLDHDLSLEPAEPWLWASPDADADGEPWRQPDPNPMPRLRLFRWLMSSRNGGPN